MPDTATAAGKQLNRKSSGPDQFEDGMVLKMVLVASSNCRSLT